MFRCPKCSGTVFGTRGATGVTIRCVKCSAEYSVTDATRG